MNKKMDNLKSLIAKRRARLHPASPVAEQAAPAPKLEQKGSAAPTPALVAPVAPAVAEAPVVPAVEEQPVEVPQEEIPSTPEEPVEVVEDVKPKRRNRKNREVENG